LDNTAVLDYSIMMVPKLILCAFDILFISKPSFIVFIFIYHWNLSVQVGVLSATKHLSMEFYQ